MARYHDEEWGVPLHNDLKHFEFIVLDGAQAGLSWSTILYKREGYRSAFDGFDPEKVARYDRRRIRRLLVDPGIVRNRLKIESAVKNARAFLAVKEEFGAFDRYIWRFTGGRTLIHRRRSLAELPARSPESDAMSKDLKARAFTFVGSTICYAYMQAAGMVNDHLIRCFRHAEVCRLAGAGGAEGRARD
jgi:DNA-3-methyladenine glycosylase I